MALDDHGFDLAGDFLLDSDRDLQYGLSIDALDLDNLLCPGDFRALVWEESELELLGEVLRLGSFLPLLSFTFSRSFSLFLWVAKFCEG